MRKRKIMSFGVAVYLILAFATGCEPKILSEEEYIKKYSIEFNMGEANNNSDLDSIKKNIKDKKIVFTNENHGVEENAIIQNKMVGYLIDNWGLKNILIEGGYAKGVILNTYIQTGDEELLNEYKKNNLESITNNDSYYKYIQSVYEKNKLLPEDKKITLIGIDSIENVQSVIMFTNFIIKHNTSLSDSQISTLKTFNDEIGETDIVNREQKYDVEENKKNVLSAVSKLEDAIATDRESYETNLRDSLLDLEFVLNNIKNDQEISGKLVTSIYNDKEYYEIRDKNTYENFRVLDEKLNLDKSYMHFGEAHAYQREFNGVKFLASYFNDDADLKGKIYSISTVYNQGGKFNYFKCTSETFSTISGELKTIISNSQLQGKNLIIDLDKADSPFKNKMSKIPFNEYDCNYGLEETYNNNGGVVTDYVQGIILIDYPRPIEWETLKKIQ